MAKPKKKQTQKMTTSQKVMGVIGILIIISMTLPILLQMLAGK